MWEAWKKELLKLSNAGRKDLLVIITKILAGELHELDIKKIQWAGNLYRCRSGKYRILFEKRGDQIKIVNIGSRGDIYKGI